MARPKAILFDVNETLLDLQPVNESIGKLLGAGPDAAVLWFTTLLQHSLVATVAGKYLDFAEVGAACLRMVAGRHGKELSEAEAREAVAPDHVAGAAATWEKVLVKLRSGAMPPVGRPRPDAAAVASFVSSVEGSLDRAAAAAPNPGRPTIHRLNRTEYANAGIPQYWTIDQDPAHTVTMYRLDGDRYQPQATMPFAWVLNTTPAEHDLG